MFEQYPDNLQAVADAMTGYEAQCQEILLRLKGKRTLSQTEQADVGHLYQLLKNELKTLAKQGTVSGARRPQTRTENQFFQPAVNAAHLALKPAINSNPITAHWFTAVLNAQEEFEYYRPDTAEPLQGH